MRPRPKTQTCHIIMKRCDEHSAMRPQTSPCQTPMTISQLIAAKVLYMIRTKGTFQKHFSGFFPLREYPPPYPLNEQSFFQKKPLGERGVPPPPPLTESLLSFSGKKIPKGTKNDIFGLNKVKNGPKRPYDRPERAKNV